MSLVHQHIVRRLNARHRHSHIYELLLILALVIWATHCWATVPDAEPITPQFIMGAPGSTATDWLEGTYADDVPGLDIDMRRCKWCRSGGRK